MVHSAAIDSIQLDCTASHRAQVMDWLVEVHDELSYCCETLHLAAGYFHRFLSMRRVCLERLQLLAITCLHVAAKVEEPRPASISSLCSWTENAYNHRDVVHMESVLLQVLGFNLRPATPLAFLQLFEECLGLTSHSGGDCGGGTPPADASAADPALEEVQHVSRWLSELALLAPPAAESFGPATLAAASLNLAGLVVHGTTLWNVASGSLAGVPTPRVPPCVAFLLDCLKGAEASAPGTFLKYASRKHHAVAITYGQGRAPLQPSGLAAPGRGGLEWGVPPCQPCPGVTSSCDATYPPVSMMDRSAGPCPSSSRGADPSEVARLLNGY